MRAKFAYTAVSPLDRIFRSFQAVDNCPPEPSRSDATLPIHSEETHIFESGFPRAKAAICNVPPGSLPSNRTLAELRDGLPEMFPDLLVISATEMLPISR
jgi:hypothetical protein